MRVFRSSVSACAAAICFASTASAQYVIPADVFDAGLNEGSSYNGGYSPSSFFDPFSSLDLRGVADDGGFDAYDYAGIILADTVGGPGAVSVSRRVDAMEELNVYRWIDTYSNGTEFALTVNINFWTNLGSDGSEIVAAQDPYRFVSFEDGNIDGLTPTDPVVAMMHGNNQWTADNISLTRFGTRGENSYFRDDVMRSCTLTLAPGESVSLMFADFLAYTPTDYGDGIINDPGVPFDVEHALAQSAALLADPSPLFADLLRGGDAPNIINWSIPTPGTIALAVFGLAGVGRRRR